MQDLQILSDERSVQESLDTCPKGTLGPKKGFVHPQKFKKVHNNVLAIHC